MTTQAIGRAVSAPSCTPAGSSRPASSARVFIGQVPPRTPAGYLCPFDRQEQPGHRSLREAAAMLPSSRPPP